MLEDMTGDTDVSFLLSTSETIPGIFTRKAWEESIEPAIKKAVHERREDIDQIERLLCVQHFRGEAAQSFEDKFQDDAELYPVITVT